MYGNEKVEYTKTWLSVEAQVEKRRVRVLNHYRPRTSLQHAAEVINFDRRLRLLVRHGIERVEVALRMRIGYVIGEVGAFATKVSDAYGAPTKKITASRVASLNYVRNVAAHHTFPATPTFTIETLGIPAGWSELELWWP